MLFTHLGFCIGFIRWVMSCITTVSFLVLINGAASPFFHAKRGLHQGCLLSPLLFLLVHEGLSRAIKEATMQGSLVGIQISHIFPLTHILFIYAILIFCSDSIRDIQTLKNILVLFSMAMGVEINEGRSSVTAHLLTVEEPHSLNITFPFLLVDINVGLKYLGFCLKPNDYLKQDWNWLIEKLEKKTETLES